jgi:uncharacterized protein (DUF488 family)
VTVVYTIGHGARDIEAFLGLLESAEIRRLVDVRTAPGSRKHPQFGRDALAGALEDRGIEYVWTGKELGGWRRARPDSRHTGITSPGFRGYADHMESDEFREARRWLMETAAHVPTAVMCAESLWWKCHRRMLADSVLAAGGEVRHIMEGGRLDPHRLHPAARIERDVPVYDRVAEQTGQARLDLEKGSIQKGFI